MADNDMMQNVGISRVKPPSSGGTNNTVDADTNNDSKSNNGTEISSDSKNDNKSNDTSDESGSKSSNQLSTSSESSVPKKTYGKKDSADADSDDSADDKSGNKASEESEKNDKKAKKEDEADIKKKLKMAKHTAKAAGGAMRLAIVQKILNFIQLMLAMLAQLLANIVAAVSAMITAFVHALITIATTIAVALGVTVAVAVFGIVAVVAIVVVCAVAYISSTVANNNVARSDSAVQTEDKCATMKKTLSDIKAGTANGNISTNEEFVKTAKQVYSVLITYGLPDYAVAGILGNMNQESGVDPYAMESVYTEPFSIGSKKQALISNNYTNDSVKNKDGGVTDYNVGMGLCQWTFGRQEAMRNYATALGKDWWDVGAQLTYMLDNGDSGDGANADIIKKMCDINDKDVYPNGDSDPVADATTYFCAKWERPNMEKANLDGRKEAASNFLAMMLEWQPDVDFANSVISKVGTVQATGSGKAASSIASACKGAYVYSDNTSAAQAAISFAYDTQEEGKGDSGLGEHGTKLYRHLVPKVTGQTTYYASCDVCVSTAIRWSGTDDDYPVYLGEQWPYVETSDKWQRIDWNYQKEKLLPGDVLIQISEDESSKIHTWMYVGHDLIAAARPEVAEANPNLTNVSASNTDRSPNLEGWYIPTVDDVAGGENYAKVRVYRNISKSGSKYKDAAADFSE